MRVRVGIPLATAAAALSVASTAWACTYFSGQTYFDDPATTGTLEQNDTKSAKKGSGLVVWGKGVAATDDYPSSPWRVVASPQGQCCGSGTTDITKKKDYTFTLDPSPGVAQLGPTLKDSTGYDATAPAGTGTYSVCWLWGDSTGKALNPATLTVTNR